MRFLVFLHVGLAVFVIGPLVAVTMACPRAIRQGTDGLPLLRWLYRTTRIYAGGSLLVAALGAAAVAPTHHSFSQFWVSSSVTLYIVAVGLLAGLVLRDQHRAIRALEAAEPATEWGRRI
ncbi:MAG TPA: hypothetical protein VNE21_07500, partial [Mycobacteriales bacterium]|nr:hypothetical protein [Mycobacteriales bacterium]